MQGEKENPMGPPAPPKDESAAEDSNMTDQDKANLMQKEEQKLRAKYPQATRPMVPGGGGGGHSAFLQKRLAKGQKYFDSGDYQVSNLNVLIFIIFILMGQFVLQMAKQRGGLRGAAAGRAAAAATAAAPPALAMPPATGDTIPTPDLVPARKTSIIQPVHDLTQSMHLPSDPAHMGMGVTEPGKPMPNPAVSLLK